MYEYSQIIKVILFHKLREMNLEKRDIYCNVKPEIFDLKKRDIYSAAKTYKYYFKK